MLVNAMGFGWVGDYAPAPPTQRQPGARQKKTSTQNRGVGACSPEDLEINHLYSHFIQVSHLLIIKPGASLEEPLCWWLNFQLRLGIQPDFLKGTAQQFLAFTCDPTQKRYNQFQFHVLKGCCYTAGLSISTQLPGS